MIRYELNDLEFVEYRIIKIRKDFRELISKEEFMKEKEFMTLVQGLDQLDNSPKLMKKTSLFIDNYGVISDSDNEIINYSNWLREKLPRKNRSVTA
jgi:hypothetical protein